MKVTGKPAACQAAADEAADRAGAEDGDPQRSAAPAIGRDALVGQPQAFGRRARSARRRRSACRRADTNSRRSAATAASSRSASRWPMPTVTSSWKPQWLRKEPRNSLRLLHSTIVSAGRIVDHEMREIGLAGDRAQRGELGRGEAHEIERARPRVGHIVEHRLFGRSGQGAGLAEVASSPSRAPPSSSRARKPILAPWTSLVSTEWLAGHLGEPDLVVVDASWHMPAQRPQRSRRISRRAHPRRALPRHRRGQRQVEPGAAHAADRRRSSARRWSSSASAATTASSSMTIRRSAPRRAAGSCFATSAPSRSRSSTAASRNGSPKAGRPRAASRSRARRASMRRSARARSSPRQQILAGLGRAAARRARQSRGSKAARPTRAPGVAPGHIPGARNLPFGALYNEDGTFKPLDEICSACSPRRASTRRSRSSPAAARASPPISLIFAAHLLGNDEARLYDGSWSEWGADPATPKAIGPGLAAG